MVLPHQLMPSMAGMDCKTPRAASGLMPSRHAWAWGHEPEPCREQGRQGRSSCITRSSAPEGKNPHSRVVGPNKARTGVLTASAICMGAESPVTTASASPHRAKSCLSPVLLTKEHSFSSAGKSGPCPIQKQPMLFFLSRAAKASNAAGFHVFKSCVAKGCRATTRLKFLRSPAIAWQA